MRSTVTTRSAGLALAAAAALALSACSSGDDSSSSSSSTTTTSSSSTSEAPASTSTSEPAPTSEAPTSEAPTSTEPAPATDSPTTEPGPSSDAAGGDSGDKPSKQAVAAGTKKIFTEQAAKDPSSAASRLIDPDKLANCVADKGYNQLSPAFLKVLAAGDTSSNTPGTANDRSVFTKLAAQCGPESLKAGASAPTS